MKIDPELRRAITAMSKRKPEQSWQQKEAANKQAIEDFFTANPKAKKTIFALRAKQARAQKEAEDARALLCGKYGLRFSSYEADADIEFARCDSDNEAFVKAGGKPPAEHPDKWNLDSVIAKLAKATPEEGAEILKQIGVNWS